MMVAGVILSAPIVGGMLGELAFAVWERMP